ncbi:MAG TPA: peptide ABC transporter substrate-binding protein [Candidatus Limnocylindrales bacterium]|jgi:peptide/nickel transport system substrate-binding protein
MRKRLFGLLAVGAIVVSACGPAATSQSPSGSTGASQPPASGSPTASQGAFDPASLFQTDYAPEAGTDGGTVVVGDWQEGGAQNPYYVGQVTFANVSAAAFASLIVFTHDFKYYAYEAEEIPTLDNGGVVLGQGGDAMTVTWKLRDNIKWSDGKAVTCDDYKYAWQWVMDEANVAVVKSGHEDITNFECKSDTEMVLHFSKIFEGYIAMFSSPLRKDWLDKFPIADQLNGAGFTADVVADIPTNGPFKFESQTPGQDLRLVRNDNFTSPGDNGHKAYLESLIFKWYGDVPGMIAGYKSGEVDVATDLQDSDIPAVQDLGEEVSAIPALLYEFLRPNHGKERCSRNAEVKDRGTGCPVSDPAIREALKLAVDKERINTQLLGGNAEIAQTNTSPSAWFYVPQEGSSTQDLEAAKKALDDAGWTVGSDGVREKDGLKAIIELCTTTRQVRQDTLALIASWLDEIGIKAVVHPVDATTAIFQVYGQSNDDTPCNLAHNNFDVAEHAYSSSPDPLGNYYIYHSSQFRPEGQNEAQISIPAVDEALDTVKDNVDFAKVQEAMATFQQIYVDETLEVPLYYRKNVELHSPELGNFFANGTLSSSMWNAWDWFRKGG